MKIFYVLMLAVGLSGCASAINERTSQKYTVMAAQAQAKGDWDTARRAYARAVVNAELARSPANTQALLTYEYGRSLGVTCFFDLAEPELKRAYELDKKAGNPLYLSLTELARLNLDQKKYHPAASYFAQSIEEMDKKNLEKISPIGYADILDEYAIALNETGRPNEATVLKKRSAAIRAANTDSKSITDRTPYGKFCTVKK